MFELGRLHGHQQRLALAQLEAERRRSQEIQGSAIWSIPLTGLSTIGGTTTGALIKTSPGYVITGAFVGFSFGALISTLFIVLAVRYRRQ
ncbi:MAG: hypothetical protein F6J89_19965 [Symploca sp. SIO1C4]|uniref:Uncharacterized protein n=1 Tax=Symploca sp. SIO1C4 TaxID=2607765 RepID=A0A6B3NKQ9_9CYAN|nr:hypothetical protein [Symploca sp. SIO1C4]